jgi:hypothetical protein
MIKHLPFKHRGSWVMASLAMAMTVGMSIPGPNYTDTPTRSPPEPVPPLRGATSDKHSPPSPRRPVACSPKERNAKKRIRKNRAQGRK